MNRKLANEIIAQPLVLLPLLDEALIKAQEQVLMNLGITHPELGGVVKPNAHVRMRCVKLK